MFRLLTVLVPLIPLQAFYLLLVFNLVADILGTVTSSPSLSRRPPQMRHCPDAYCPGPWVQQLSLHSPTNTEEQCKELWTP